MSNINLLPWREERRAELQRQFFSIVAGVAILAGLCVFVVYGYFNGEIDSQLARNKFIEGKIADLETKITQIQALQERRDQIVDSMKVIQDLQGNRPVIVYSMGALASSTPDGVYYTKVQKLGNVYTMNGLAESNNRISKLMRNLDESDWFKEPVLIKVEGVPDPVVGDEEVSQFELVVKQEKPGGEDEEEEQQVGPGSRRPPGKGKAPVRKAPKKKG